MPLKVIKMPSKTFLGILENACYKLDSRGLLRHFFSKRLSISIYKGILQLPIIVFKGVLYKPSNIDRGVIKNASKTNSYM